MSSAHTVAATDARRRDVNKFMVVVNRIGIYVVVIMLVILGIFVAPGKFLTISNFTSTIQAVSLLGITAIGLSFVVFSANFNDLSVPMTIAFSGMIAVATINLGFWPSAFIGVAAGTALGFINGLMIGKFRAHPVVWSMAFNFVMSGIVRWIWSGNQIYPDVAAGSNLEAAETFFSISRSSFLGIPLMVLVMVILFVLAQFILKRTRFGNQLMVVGSNYEVARLSGINVVKSIVVVYLLNAFCASVCGLFLASMAKTGAYYNGEGYDFRGVTAVLLGGMTLEGGKGDLIGVFGGVFTVGLLMNIMTLIGVPTFGQWLVQGLVFLLIVWINTNSSRKLGKS